MLVRAVYLIFVLTFLPLARAASPGLVRVCPGGRVEGMSLCLPHGAWQPVLGGWQEVYRERHCGGVAPHAGRHPSGCPHRDEPDDWGLNDPRRVGWFGWEGYVPGHRSGD